jgi:hypothetical protein
MANRLVRNTAILLKSEVTYGLDPVPTGAANALLVSNVSVTPINANLVDRAIIRPFLGGSEQLVGTRYAEVSFDLELAGSGTVATSPAWSAALLACGMAETLVATFRADYTPVSSSFPSVTIYHFDDGVRHTFTGARGECTIKLNQAEKPVLSFKFTGLYTTPTAVALPSVTLTAWKTPQVICDANTGDLMFGGTHTTGTAPVITGGTPYPSQGIEISLGNSVNFNPLLGGEDVQISARNVTGKVTLDLTAAQEVIMMQNVESATLTSVGLSHGTVANQKVLLWLPSVQLSNPAKAEVNGKRLVSFDLRVLPVSGNDEIRLVTSF